jgi:hypothetical protein
MSEDKSFHAVIAKTKAHASGFRITASGRPFVSLHIGDRSVGGEFSMIIRPAEARAIAEALLGAADFAEPREASGADLGIEDAA